MECFIEFAYNDELVFKRIYELIEYIKKQKELENLDSDDSTILNFYTEEELEYYWWPSEEENKDFWVKYYSLSNEERYLLLKEKPWDLESVIYAINTGEYTINGVVVDKKYNARLYFDPWSFPYGGTEPLIELIKPFNIKIIRVEN
ncbi:hypothetical protein [Clostridium tertium]|uniref:hypothetical protein n=1 Tax=Clostridium tertium TaxID=1559 RepID=UPI0034A4C9C6